MYISLLHGRVVLVQQDDDLFAIIARQIARQGVQGACRQIVFHICRYLAEIVLFFFIQAAALQQEIVFIVQFRDDLADLPSGVRERARFHLCKRKADDRAGSLKAPVPVIPIRGFFLPDGKAFEQFPFPRKIYGKELLHHAHVQRLAKAPGAGNQGHAVLVFPPFFDETGLVYIKDAFCDDCLEILMSDADCPCHKFPPNMMICLLPRNCLQFSDSSYL